MKENNQQVYYQDDEITLKELILKVQEYWGEVWKNKWWIILVSGLFAAGFLVKAWITPITYVAELTFMVDEDEGGGLGAVAGILGQFGLGGGRRGKYNLDKIIKLAESRKIIAETLFETVKIDGKNDFLGNHLIRIYNFHDDWKGDTIGLDEYYFENKSLKDFSRVDNLVLKMIYRRVVGDGNTEGLLTKGYRDDTGILFLKIESESELLSLNFVKLLYKNLSNFYVEKAIEKQEKTYQLLREKVDSIQVVMNDAQYKLLQFEDNSRGLLLRQSSFKKQQLQQEVQKMMLAYGEAYKNLEIAEFSLKNKTPFIVTIDEPIEPITVVEKSKIKGLFIGGLLGGFFSLFFIIVRKIYNDTLK